MAVQTVGRRKEETEKNYRKRKEKKWLKIKD
jgi:hypothetical protein